ncbi:hypothetical protein K469DRAFT_14088 [Zopfia rhizophila CBS 207.26]|uniref:Uncharacterized protein n=1 Tax=Zopfia rhizophila CBS 207.26 TaxID=1314779 RepID=A0A6A6EXJ6_9PEZI|nr:hypothetical protein K469DRAFT_14088 [Zopfia rhizophila CBS 207.26]
MELTRENAVNHTNHAESLIPQVSNCPYGHGSLYSGTRSCAIRCRFGRWCGEGRTSWPVYRCEVEDCDTRLALKRHGERENGNQFLVLRVERYLGGMRSADDGRWMAQIVEASRLDEDRFYWGKGAVVTRRC